MKASQLLAVLMPEPLGYRVARRRGSHRRLTAPGYPPLTWAFHDKRSLAPSEVRRVLVRHVGLDEDEALRLL